MFWPVATNEPDGTTAPSSGAIAAQTPKPPTPEHQDGDADQRRQPRLLRGTSRYHDAMLGQARHRSLCSAASAGRARRLPPACGLRRGGRRRLRRLEHQRRRTSLRRAEGLDPAAAQDQHLVDDVEHGRALRDHHDGDAPLLARAQRLGQRLLAGGVEVGVRLVEHDQRRIAEERARQRDALLLAARERRAAALQHGLVAVAARWQIMSCTPVSIGRLVDRLVGQIVAHAADIVLDGAGEQLDLLRQVAGEFAELPAVPVAQLGAVEAHLAGGR